MNVAICDADGGRDKAKELALPREGQSSFRIKGVATFLRQSLLRRFPGHFEPLWQPGLRGKLRPRFALG